MEQPATFAFDESRALYGPIRAMVEDQFGDARTKPSLRVHQNDEMFHHSIAACPTPRFGKMAYFRAGLQILDALRQTAGWHDRPLASMDRVLDFAAGYGRSTRFLAALIPPERIWMADILPDAVDFQRSEFGVNSMQSSKDPADFRCDEKFDLIFVSSLFSHLPERTWGTWLERLHSLLAPSGLLVFSVHGETLVPATHQMPDDGLLFLPQNEADSWDVADYGTSFVTEAFVSRVIEQRLPSENYVYLPRSLCFNQDLYIVRGAGRVPEDRRFLRGPYGQVEEFRLVDDRKRTYQARGWAVDMDGGPSPQVVLKVGTEQRAEVTPSVDRPELSTGGQFLAIEGLVANGWSTSFQLPRTAFRQKTALTVIAESPTSETEFVLDLLPFQVQGSTSWIANRGRRLVHLVRTAAQVQRKSGWATTARLAREHWTKPTVQK